jgi:hypothetical protein
VIADEPLAPAGKARSLLVGRRIHPAYEVVLRTEQLWQDDRQIAGDRAKLILQRLIETGWLRGRMSVEIPLALGDEAAAYGRRGLGPYWVDPEPVSLGEHTHNG